MNYSSACFTPSQDLHDPGTTKARKENHRQHRKQSSVDQSVLTIHLHSTLSRRLQRPTKTHYRDLDSVKERPLSNRGLASPPARFNSCPTNGSHKVHIFQPSSMASAGSAKPLRALTQVGDRVDEAALQQADCSCV